MTASGAARRARTSTATAGRTWRSASRAGSSSSCATGAATGSSRAAATRCSNRGLPDAGRYGNPDRGAVTSTATSYGDLAVGAPGEDAATPGIGSHRAAVRRPGRPHDRGGATIRRPDGGYASIREPAARRATSTATATSTSSRAPLTALAGRRGARQRSAPARPDGPRRCEPLGGGGTSSVAVADVTGDGFDDIVQGDAVDVRPFEGSEPVAGEVRLWRGGAARAGRSSR